MLRQSFNQDWRFTYDAYVGWATPHLKNTSTVDLPHDFLIGLPRSAENPSGRDGAYFPGKVGYYSKVFTVPGEMTGKNVFLEFEGVYMNATVRLNNNHIAQHPYGYSSFICDLTPYINYGGENELIVFADASAMPSSRWYSGGGIYRPVWLYYGDRAYIQPWGVGVTTQLEPDGSATVKAQLDIANPLGLQCSAVARILDEDGNEVHTQSEPGKPLEMRVRWPLLWELDSPTVYTLEVYLLADGVVCDRASVPFGIREVKVSPTEGLTLNGTPLKLKGGCVHHDNGILGAASYRSSEFRRVELLKASGYNAVRTAHNPPSPAFLDACDRLGMLVIDEAFDVWHHQKVQHDYHVYFEDWWKRDLDSMVLRDRNHPSVIIWSIGNEILEQVGNSKAYEVCKMLADRVRELDASRPVLVAAYPTSDEDWRRIDPFFAPLDIAGYNYNFAKYASDHELFPERLIIGTETFPKDIYDSWQATLDNPHVLGDFVWTSLDYLGESAIGRAYYMEEQPDIAAHLSDYPWCHAHCGDIDACGIKRPQSYYRDILWGVRTQPYIGVRRPVPEGWGEEQLTLWAWNDCIDGWDFAGQEGRALTVEVYSPAQNVELFLNGKSLGTEPTQKLKALFRVPYEAGTLEAVDSDGGRMTLTTAGKPAALRFIEGGGFTEPGEIAFLHIEIVDEQGVRCTSADHLIFVTKQGGVLLAIGSGDPKSEEGYTGNTRRAYQGRITVAVKASGEGNITLHAMADGLRIAEGCIKSTNIPGIIE